MNAFLAFCAFYSGLCSHLVYFIHGEHNRAAPKWFLFVVFGPLLITGCMSRMRSMTFPEAYYIVTALFIWFAFGLLGSMTLYRAFFHRIGNFPGPFGARLSKFWTVAQVAAKLDYHKKLDALHQTYGDYVRTGTVVLARSSLFD